MALEQKTKFYEELMEDMYRVLTDYARLRVDESADVDGHRSGRLSACVGED
ncbi:MAG: hypothetical protein LBQ15_02310 [Clostridium sp.]|jgi:hypothetical protein|nr:hypothetical protein [Clostridium sp.]